MDRKARRISVISISYFFQKNIHERTDFFEQIIFSKNKKMIKRNTF